MKYNTTIRSDTNNWSVIIKNKENDRQNKKNPAFDLIIFCNTSYDINN